MQAFPAWSPPGGTLGEILAETRRRVYELKLRKHALEAAAAAQPRGPSLAQALCRGDVAVIAELKRRSPSRGQINPSLSSERHAEAYQAGGAAAVSVLTEPRYFGGSAADLVRVRAAVRLPVLKKDFHIDPVQLLEARSLGASAALLIARALEPVVLVDLAGEAKALGLEPLIEVRTELELERALATDATLIGVNSRDLETLDIDAGVVARLIPLVPGDRFAIAESGVSTRETIERVAAYGADAVLVGSMLSAAADPGAAVRGLTGVPRRPRAS